MLFKVSISYVTEKNALRNTMTIVDAKDIATARQMALDEAMSTYDRFQIGQITPWENHHKQKTLKV